MKAKWKKLLPLLLLPFCLTGCLGADAEIYGQETVLDYVDTVCDEPYRLTGQQLVEQTPDRMEYTFKTSDRDLTFTADSYLEPVTIDGSVFSYTREISCDYVNAVHDLYRDDIKKILEENPRYLPEHGWFYLLSFNDINSIVYSVLDADKVWQQELAFHDQAWLKKNSVTYIHLVYHTSQEEADAHSDWVNLTDISVTGSNTFENLYDKISNAYIQKAVDKEITDPSIPEHLLYDSDHHVSTLTSITLNGSEMLYDNEENPASSYGLTTEDYKTVWWSEGEDSHMILSDIGMITDNMSYPLIIREYVDQMGGEYSVKVTEDQYESRWTIGQSTWVMDVTYTDKGKIQKFGLTRNGEPIRVDILTSDDDPHVTATFVVGMKVSDFSKMLGMTYTINEAERTLVFTSGGDAS